MAEGSKIKSLATVYDVAKHFGVTDRTIRRWLKDTSIPHMRIGGTIRFNLEEVIAWAESGGVFPKEDS